MTEKELHKLFAEKLKGQSFPINEKAWRSMEQMLDPQEPLSEQEYSKLFKEKLSQASFAFNPANWDQVEASLNEAQGAMTQAELAALFNKKINADTFAFNPENWQRMEAILDQKGKKPLLYFWRSAAAILIFALASLGYQYINPINEAGQFKSIPANVSKTPSKQGLSQTESPTTPNNSTKELLESPRQQQKELNKKDIFPKTSSASGSSSLATNGPIDPASNAASELITAPADQAIVAMDESKNTLTPGDTYKLASWSPFSLEQNSFSLKELFTNPIGLVSPKKSPYVPQSFNRINVVAGPSLNPAYNGTTGAGWFIGLEFQHAFNDRLALSAGLNYNHSGDMGIESLSDSTFFGLARTEIHTHSHYKNLSTLRIPISLDVNVSPKHSFSIGAYADMLIAVRLDEQKTTTIFKQDPKVEDISRFQADNNFTNYNAGAFIAYTYHYSSRLSIGLNQQYGLSDLTADKHQNFKKHHQTSQTNLVLKYSIWEK